MPKLRDRSKIVSPKIFESPASKKKWSIEEKRKMLIYISRYGADPILKDPYAFFPTKTFDEINDYLKDLKSKKFPTSYSDHYLASRIKRPIESWHETLKELTSNVTDNSNIIALAVDKIITSEKLDISKSLEDPDWKLIYEYLFCALSNQPLPQLCGINAAVVLKLIDELISYHDNLNVCSQSDLLINKFGTLEESKSIDCIVARLQTTNQALLLGNPNEMKFELTSDDLILDVQKEPLYFLNPLNIPVKLLKPQIVHT